MPLIEVPNKVDVFWDPVGMVIFLFLLVGLVGLIVRMIFRDPQKTAIAGGPAAALTQGDLVENTTAVAVQTTVETATQTVVDPAVSGAFDWSEYESPSGFDGWADLSVPPVTPPEFPVSMGHHLSYFVSLPWGYIFAGGAAFTGMLWVYSGVSYWRRRRRLNAVTTFLQLPLVVLGGGFGSVTLVYGIGLFTGWLAAPATLLNEGLVYLRALYVPGYRTGVFSGLGFFADVGELFFTTGFSPGRLVGRVVCVSF